jgi:HEAT repeat protein
MTKRPSGRPSGGRTVLMIWLSVLALTAAFGWIALALYGRLDDYRQRAVGLHSSLEHMSRAVLSIAKEDAPGAAVALASAREAFRGPEAASLRELEADLRELPGDPLLGKLLDSRAYLRLAAMEQLYDEVSGRASERRRPKTDLRRLQSLLVDRDPKIRRRAVEICAESGLTDLVLNTLRVDQGQEPVSLDWRSFLALYRGVGKGALEGSELGRRLMGAISLDVCEKLSSDGSADREKKVRIAVAPELLVDVHGTPEVDFVREWVALNSRLKPQMVLSELPRLERLGRAIPEVIEALQRLGSPTAVDAIQRLTVTRFLDYWKSGIDALVRLGETEIVLALVDQPLPRSPLGSYAIEKAVERSSGAAQQRVASLLRNHPDPAIRRVSFEVLAHRQFFQEQPQAFIPALSDPYLRELALERLKEWPCPESLPALLGLLSSSSADLRTRVIRALEHSTAPSLLFPLVGQLYETDTELRATVLSALAKLEDDRALPLAVGILEPGYPGLEELAKSLLSVSPAARREDPALLVLALRELLAIESSEAASYDLGRLRRRLLLRRLDMDYEGFDGRLPLSARRVIVFESEENDKRADGSHESRRMHKPLED